MNKKPSAAGMQAEKGAINKLLQPEIAFSNQTYVNDIIAGFAQTKNVKESVDCHSDTSYGTLSVSKEDLRSVYADILFTLSVGKVFGPYEGDGNLKLSRMIAKDPNGAAKASHILIAHKSSQAATPNITRTKEEIKARAESLLVEAKVAGADFAASTSEDSDEPGANYCGGDLGFSKCGAMVKPFEQSVSANPVGTIGIVGTDFGYHVVKVTDKVPTAQSATITRKAEPPEATLNELFSKMSNFEMKASQNPKDFSNIAKSSDLTAFRVDNLHKNDDQTIGLGADRQTVQWLLNKEAKVGDLKKLTNGDNYMAAQLVKQREEGLSDVQDVAPFVKPILIREKKVVILKEKAKGNSLAAVASASKTEVKTAAGLTMNNPISIGEGREPKIIGAAFGLKQGIISKSIDGENAVYVIQVLLVSVVPVTDDYKAYAETIEKLRTECAGQGVLRSLENSATIKEDISALY